MTSDGSSIGQLWEQKSDEKPFRRNGETMILDTLVIKERSRLISVVENNVRFLKRLRANHIHRQKMTILAM